MLDKLPYEELMLLRDIRRKEAEECIAFANAYCKARYDAGHKLMEFAVGSSVYLQLHKGYTIPGLSNRKLSHQRVGPFKVIRRVGRLAYHLDLPPVMHIYPIISIAFLEPASASPDPYNRMLPEPPPVITATEHATNDATEEDREYTIERLMGKRISRGKVQYLVKWDGFHNGHNVWYDVDDLRDASEAILDYEKLHSEGVRPQRHRRGRR